MRSLLFSAVLGIGAPALAAQGFACSASTGASTIPLVELYTSEGCDSCPPADRWLRNTFPPESSAARASVLAFHVDYWDSLGWRDRFADAAYTARQRAMVHAAGGRTIYTPQLLVQGRDRGLWRDRGIAEVLDSVARTPARANIRLAAKPDNAAVLVDVHANLAGARPADVVTYIALTESALSSAVTAGENAGAKLVHDHVVRALLAAPAFDANGASSGMLRFPFAHERGTHPMLVAFV
ncbi:MAG TPA: DUF1223 domain-containing protein, partial [Casimicrobiaceae bacterium]|nr:DUF1223 domain-containing protein [Casimicrobiaceae bacterium]